MHKFIRSTLKGAVLLAGALALPQAAFAVPVFSIVPTSTTPITLVGTGGTSMNYTVTNNANVTVTGLNVFPLNGDPGTVMVSTLSGDTCSGVNLASHQSCVFNVAFQAQNLPAVVALSPKVCGFQNGVCAQATQRIQVTIQKSTVHTPLVIGGFYFDGTVDRPLVIETQNGGASWNYISALTVPTFTLYPFVTDGFLVDFTCTGNVCMGTGEYYDGTVTRPMIAVSQDSGQSWTFPQTVNSPVLSTHPFLGAGVLRSAPVCNGSGLCLAAGSYEDTLSDYRPLVAMTTDNGVTWSYSDSATLMNMTTHPYHATAYTVGMVCQGNFCFSGGSYSDGATYRPFILMSQNGGSTWTSPESPTSPVLTTHPFVANGSLTGSVSCATSYCIAAGAYGDGMTNRPLVIYTSDQGANWSYSDSASTPNMTTVPFVSNGQINSSSCTGDTCVVAGSYTNSSVYPLLGVTTDGNHWTFPNNISTPVFSHAFNSGNFTYVSCSASLCVAVGYYYDGSTNRPLMAVSTNAGSSWTYNTAVTTPTLTTHPFVSQGLFRKVYCQQNYCAAAGSYHDGTVTRPLLAVSQDGAVTWQFVDSATTPVLSPHPYTNNGVLGETDT